MKSPPRAPVRLWLGVVAVLWSLHLFPLLGAVAVIPAESPSVVFAGRAAEIEWRMENRGAEAASADFSYRIFQLTSATSAPLAPTQAWKHVAIAAGQRVIESLPIALPETRALTLFRVEISVDGVVRGRQAVLACPPGMLRDSVVSLHGAGVDFAAVLGRLGLKLTPHRVDAPAQEDAVVIFGPYAGDSPARAELATRVREARAGDRGCLVLLPARELAGRTSLAVVTPRSRTKLVFADAAHFFHLEESAAAQLELSQLLQLALGREPIPLLDAIAR